MSDSFVEKLTLIVATVLWAPVCEFDFQRRPATKWIQEIERTVLKRKDFG
jgi:hypothetical protein